jgi:hypothetical protein
VDPITPHEHCVRIVASVLYQGCNAEWERAVALAEPAVVAIEGILSDANATRGPEQGSRSGAPERGGSGA